MKWQFKMEAVDVDREFGVLIQEVLDLASEEGWELVSVTSQHHSGDKIIKPYSLFQLWFKKPAE